MTTIVKKPILILAIETSCDETAAAVLSIAVDAKKHRTNFDLPKVSTLSSVVKSQITLHNKMGGVVPETAARAHVKNILPVVKKVLADAGRKMSGRTKQVELKDINYIAVTQGPGLLPSLMIGVEFAKALSLATGIPLMPINHMAGHLYSPFGRLIAKSYKLVTNLFPQIALIVSGGHTMIVLMKNLKEYTVIGQTVDDAAGEAFDKVAKLLGLPYPGGPEVSMLAQQANQPVDFPRPMIHSKDYNFSFSGLKTAVLYYVQSLNANRYTLNAKQDICAGFQNAVVDVLVTKTLRAAKEFKAKSISVSGGVSANKVLRRELNFKSRILNLEFFVPPKNLCTDNAEMIGLAAAIQLHHGKKPIPAKKIQANPNLHL